MKPAILWIVLSAGVCWGQNGVWVTDAGTQPAPHNSHWGLWHDSFTWPDDPARPDQGYQWGFNPAINGKGNPLDDNTGFWEYENHYPETGTGRTWNEMYYTIGSPAAKKLLRPLSMGFINKCVAPCSGQVNTWWTMLSGTEVTVNGESSSYPYIAGSAAAGHALSLRGTPVQIGTFAQTYWGFNGPWLFLWNGAKITKDTNNTCGYMQNDNAGNQRCLIFLDSSNSVVLGEAGKYHTVLESEWQALMARLNALEHPSLTGTAKP